MREEAKNAFPPYKSEFSKICFIPVVFLNALNFMNGLKCRKIFMYKTCKIDIETLLCQFYFKNLTL